MIVTQHVGRRNKVKPVINKLKCDPNILSVSVGHVLKYHEYDICSTLHMFTSMSGSCAS